MVKEDQNHDVRRWSQGEDRLVRVGMHCIPKYTKSILESMLIVIENKLSQITIPFMYFISCSCVEMILPEPLRGMLMPVMMLLHLGDRTGHVVPRAAALHHHVHKEEA